MQVLGGVDSAGFCGFCVLNLLQAFDRLGLWLLQSDTSGVSLCCPVDLHCEGDSKHSEVLRSEYQTDYHLQCSFGQLDFLKLQMWQ